MPTLYSKEVLGKDRVDGFYETPEHTVRYMVDLALSCVPEPSSVLDPCVGDGVFLREFQRRGFPQKDLHGFDIDADKVANLKALHFNVELRDATGSFPNKYDIIIGNPPYSGDESHFIRENRDRLKRDYADIGAKNTFSMISYNCIRHLKQGGVFVQILSDAFLTNRYYEKFREFLLDSLELKKLILCPRHLFRHIGADVGTCIIVGVKKSPDLGLFSPANSDMVEMVDRLSCESQYSQPPSTERMNQTEFRKFPLSAFIIGVPECLKETYLSGGTPLGEVLQGGTGISTGNDRKFLKKLDEIPEHERDDWVPYYKNGARSKFYYQPAYFIERDYQKNNKSTSNYLIRNERFFFNEGITCSSVGVRFSAAYMPEGGLFGVNANFFSEDKTRLMYVLGFLNTKIAWYFARRILVRTNNISSSYLKRMPILFPGKGEEEDIANLVWSHVQEKMINDSTCSLALEDELNQRFSEIYSLTLPARIAIDEFCEDFYSKL